MNYRLDESELKRIIKWSDSVDEEKWLSEFKIVLFGKKEALLKNETGL